MMELEIRKVGSVVDLLISDGSENSIKIPSLNDQEQKAIASEMILAASELLHEVNGDGFVKGVLELLYNEMG